MGFQLIKKIYLIIISSFFIIIKSYNYWSYDYDVYEIYRLRDELRKRKDELDELKRDEEIFDFIYKILLLGFIIFFLMIVLQVVIYEIVNCCIERKKELEIIVKNISKSKIAKKF